jgi:hypothetical protein
MKPGLMEGISFLIRSIEPCFCQLAAKKVDGILLGTTMEEIDEVTKRG